MPNGVTRREWAPWIFSTIGWLLALGLLVRDLT